MIDNHQFTRLEFENISATLNAQRALKLGYRK